MKISKAKTNTLNIDLDDSYITISYAGVYNGNKQFMWATLEPTETTQMDSFSEVLSFEESCMKFNKMINNNILYGNDKSINFTNMKAIFLDFITDTTFNNN